MQRTDFFCPHHSQRVKKIVRENLFPKFAFLYGSSSIEHHNHLPCLSSSPPPTFVMTSTREVPYRHSTVRRAQRTEVYKGREITHNSLSHFSPSSSSSSSDSEGRKRKGMIDSPLRNERKERGNAGKRKRRRRNFSPSPASA